MSGKTEITAGLMALLLFVSAATVRHNKGNRVTVSARSFISGAVGLDSVKIDAETGLAIDDQLMLVKGQCTACHSSKLILQSHFPREKWVERIRWMQRTQNLWDLGESEPAILTYLTKHYGPVKRAFDGRREPLKAVQWHSRSN